MVPVATLTSTVPKMVETLATFWIVPVTGTVPETEIVPLTLVV